MAFLVSLMSQAASSAAGASTRDLAAFAVTGVLGAPGGLAVPTPGAASGASQFIERMERILAYSDWICCAMASAVWKEDQLTRSTGMSCEMSSRKSS